MQIPDVAGRAAGRADPDLNTIAQAWPTLPVTVRAGIMAMIGAFRPTGSDDNQGQQPPPDSSIV